MKNFIFKCKLLLRYVFILIAFLVFNLYVVDGWVSSYNAKVTGVDVDYVKVKKKIRKKPKTYTKEWELRNVLVVTYFDGKNEYTENLASPSYTTKEKALELVGSNIRVMKYDRELREAPILKSIVLTIILVILWIGLFFMIILKIIVLITKRKSLNVSNSRESIIVERTTITEDEFNNLFSDYFNWCIVYLYYNIT